MPDHSQVRYYFEHRFLPKLFYDPNIFLPLAIKKNPAVIQQNWESLQDQNGLDNPYAEDAWNVQMFELTDKYACVRLFCPPPEKEPQCKWIYMLFHYNLKKRYYFTVEVGGLFEQGPFLCGWDRNLKHQNYGVCEDDVEKALDQAIVLYEQMEADPEQ